MTLEVGKIYYIKHGINGEDITITLDNKTKFPDRSLNAIFYHLQYDHTGLGRLSDGIELRDVSNQSFGEPMTNEANIRHLQQQAIIACYSRPIRRK